MRGDIVRELQTEYENQRMADHQEELRRREEAVAVCPALEAALNGRQQLIFDGMNAILAGKMTADQLPEKMAAYNHQVETLLTQHGFAPTYLDPVYRCPVCKDTGYVGELVRDMCDCMRKRLNDRLFQNVGLTETVPQTFERFDEQLFSAEKLPGQMMSQRELMNRIRHFGETWANAYPQVTKNTVLLQGPSGLGKTYMLHAMAHRLLERGQNVLIISAYRFLELARKAYFTSDSSALDGIMDADVLMIDDFGTEPLMENVTIVQWFNLINERQTRHKATVISTNLGPQEIRNLYTERIASRLLDQNSSVHLQFAGDDIRRRGGNRA